MSGSSLKDRRNTQALPRRQRDDTVGRVALAHGDSANKIRSRIRLEAFNSGVSFLSEATMKAPRTSQLGTVSKRSNQALTLRNHITLLKKN